MRNILVIFAILFTNNVGAINLGIGGQHLSESREINNIQDYDASGANILFTIGNNNFKLKLSEDIKSTTVKLPFGKLSFDTSSIDIYPFFSYENITVENSESRNLSFNYLGFGVESENLETNLNSGFKEANLLKSGLHLSKLLNYLFDIVIENTQDARIKKGVYPFVDYYLISGDVTNNLNQKISVDGEGTGIGIYAWWLADAWDDKEFYIDLIYAKYSDEYDGGGQSFKDDNTTIRVDFIIKF